MKALRTLITAILLLASANCYAEWIDAKNTKGDMSDEEVKQFLKDTDKEFFIPINKAKNGFKICAFDASLSSMVSLRYLNNKVDYEISLFENQWVGEGTIYLQLLDEDKYLIESHFISKIVEDYTGDLLGNFTTNWATFKKIKYYRLSMRV